MAPKDSEDLDMNDGASAPDTPMALELTDFDATSATLKWKTPLKDNGSAINGYIVEYREPRGEEEWIESEKFKPNKYPSGKVEQLTTGCKYEFRVMSCFVPPTSDQIQSGLTYMYIL